MAIPDQTGRYLIADRMDDPKVCDCHVIFRDTVTGKRSNSSIALRWMRISPNASTVHPHPQFCLGDRYICHSTTIHGRVDVALVPTSSLIERIS